MPKIRGKRHSEAMAKTPFSFVLVPDFVNRRMEGSVSRKVNSVSRMEVSVRHLLVLSLSSV